jgi:hypothetical protein
MSDFKPRPGTFLPFLRFTNRSKPARPSPLTLLEILSRQLTLSLPLFDLQARSGMQPAPYVESLKSLRNAGYIAVEGEALEETVKLTDSGANLSRLARPA